MSTKVVELSKIGEVTIYKRKGQSTIRLSVSEGVVKVTQPTWLPFSAGEAFLKSKLSWVQDHHRPKELYKNNSPIGKKHTLAIEYGDKQSSKIANNILSVTLPFGSSEISKVSQTYIRKSVLKVLRNEAEDYLPLRTRELATHFGFTFRSVSIKHLKRRWGSCNSKKEITYNLYLMQLSSSYIDYVILHELTHTIHMDHGEKFWKKMEEVYPGARKTARIVRRLSNS